MDVAAPGQLVAGQVDASPAASSWTGQPVGVQDLGAEHFRAVRSVETGSWLGRAHQGQGLGREMREAILHLAFAGLGAEEALSGAFEDNAASLATSRAVGYEENGEAQRAPPRRFGAHDPLPPGPRRLGATAARRHRDRRARGVPRHVRRPACLNSAGYPAQPQDAAGPSVRVQCIGDLARQSLSLREVDARPAVRVPPRRCPRCRRGRPPSARGRRRRVGVGPVVEVRIALHGAQVAREGHAADGEQRRQALLRGSGPAGAPGSTPTRRERPVRPRPWRPQGPPAPRRSPPRTSMQGGLDAHVPTQALQRLGQGGLDGPSAGDDVGPGVGEERLVQACPHRPRSAR